jgi:WS/DGAT/MGAT family acyltransferase
MSDLDAAFLAGETPTQHLHVLATLVLDAPRLSADSRYRLFQRRLDERFHLIAPMRRRLRELPFGNPVWVDDPALQLDRHLHHVILPDGGGLEALACKASEIASYALPRDRPLWEAWFVEGINNDQFAVIAKIHHSAVDGVSGIFSLAAFFDLEPAAQPTPGGPRWEPDRQPSIAELGRAIVDDVRHRPASIGRSLFGVASSGLAFARTRDASAPLPFTGPRLSFNGALSSRRSVAYGRLRLDDLKVVRGALGATVNEVLMAVCAGGLRRYLAQHDELPDRPVVAGVPVSERLVEHGLTGNRLAFMFCALPVHVADPIERVHTLQQSATAAKDLYTRAGAGLLQNLAGLTPHRALGPIARAMSSLRLANSLPPVFNVIVSNIRGPDMPLYAGGAQLATMYPMGPLGEGVGLGITAVTYRHDVSVGFMACPDLVPDVHELASAVEVELEAMRDVASAFASKTDPPPIDARGDC